jgi:di/tricarboxylate transporter
MLSIQHRFNPLHVYCRLVERGLNKKSCLSICRYYEILIYSWLVWFTIVTVRICKPTHGRIRIKMLLLLLFAVALFFGVTGIAMAIPIELTHVWYPTASEPAIMLLLGSSLIGIAGFLRRKFKRKALTIWNESNESYSSR